MVKTLLPEGFTPPHLLAGLPASTPVLLAFSGGPDSSALLSMLKASCDICGAPLFAAHVDHLIRKDEHQRDLDFCKKTAESLGVELFTLTENVPSIAKEGGESLELAARRVRYAFFDKIMKEKGIPILATAHNADDNLETLLLNLTRGCGLRGLCGIPPCREVGCGKVVRPILGMTKADILAYCEENGVDYVIDSTNAVADCARNSLRLRVIPELKKLCGSVSENASRTCRGLREDLGYIEGAAEDFLTMNRDALPIKELCSLPLPVKKRVLTAFFGDGLEETHITALLELAGKCVPHSSLSLPENTRAMIEDGCITKTKDTKTAKKVGDFAVPLKEGRNSLPGGFSLIVSENESNIRNVYNSITNASIPFDTINGTLFARNRRGGDRIRLRGMNRSVKKLMCDKKIPLGDRDSLPVVCDDLGILFIPGIGVRDASAKNIDRKIYISLIKG